MKYEEVANHLIGLLDRDSQKGVSVLNKLERRAIIKALDIVEDKIRGKWRKARSEKKNIY